MADKRINALTTTSASVGDDYFAIDGATNGTRALSAFSPTFGGNATVTGTLTVNGSANGIVANGAGISLNTDYSASVRFFDGATVKWWIYKLSSDENLYFRDMGNARMQLQMLPGATSSTAISTFNSRLEVTSTTASTTTSSGALVVGNGTSGGLGVGGAIVAGGTITSTASTDSGLLQLNLVNSSTGTSASSLFRFNAGTRTATLQAYNDTHATLAGQLRVGTSNGDIVLIPSGVAATTFGSSTVTVNHSTASTSTSSGALVVAGGVGVAGAVYTGGGVVISGSTGVSVIGGRQWSFKANSSGGSPASGCVIRDDSAAADRLTIDINGDSVFAGSLKTSAPSGGTAAAWKLGTVATVSPTSPNRTIEVDIGGTIYYIHAKTTNN